MCGSRECPDDLLPCRGNPLRRLCSRRLDGMVPASVGVVRTTAQNLPRRQCTLSVPNCLAAAPCNPSFHMLHASQPKAQHVLFALALNCYASLPMQRPSTNPTHHRTPTNSNVLHFTQTQSQLLVSNGQSMTSSATRATQHRWRGTPLPGRTHPECCILSRPGGTCDSWLLLHF